MKAIPNLASCKIYAENYNRCLKSRLSAESGENRVYRYTCKKSINKVRKKKKKEKV